MATYNPINSNPCRVVPADSLNLLAVRYLSSANMRLMSRAAAESEDHGHHCRLELEFLASNHELFAGCAEFYAATIRQLTTAVSN